MGYTVKKIWGAYGVLLLVGALAACQLGWQTRLTALFPEDLLSVQDLERLATDESKAPFQIVALDEAGEAGLTDFKLQLLDKGYIEAIGEPAFAPLAYSVRLSGLPPEDYQLIRKQMTGDALSIRLGETRQELAGLLDPATLALIKFDPLRLYEYFPPDRFVLSDSYRPAATFQLEQGSDRQSTYDALNQEINAFFAGVPSVGLTGAPAFAVEIGREMNRDMQRLMPIVFIMVLGLFYLVYRRLKPLLLLVVVQTASLSAALLVAWLCFGKLNAIGLGFASILLGIGVDYAILMVHPHTKHRMVTRGIWLSSITTAIAFIWLGVSTFPGIQQVGVLVSAGIPAAALAAIVFAKIFRLGSSELHENSDDTDTKRRATWQPWLVLVVFCAGSLLWKGWPVDLSPERLTPQHIPAWQVQSVMLSPEIENGMQALANEFDEVIAAMHSNQQMDKQDCTDSSEWARVLQQNGFGASWGESIPEIFAYIDGFAAGDSKLPDTLKKWTAWPRLGVDAERRAWQELPLFFLISVLSIAMVLRIGLGGWTCSLICLGMAAGTLLLMGGMFSLINFQLTLVSILCLPVIPGLAVDYAIHIHLAGRHCRSRVGLFQAVGIPILLAGSTSAAGFLILGMSSQPVLSNLGVTLGCGILCALLVNALGVGILNAGAAKNKIQVHSETLYQSNIFDYFTKISGWLPRPQLNRLAYACGYIYGWIHPERTEIVARNLGLIAPEYQHRRNACRVYGNFATTLSDYFHMYSCDDAKISSWIAGRHGKEYLMAAHKAGKGGIILSMHHGFFEFGGWLMQELGIPFSVVTNAEPSEALTKWRADYRKRWNAETIILGHDGFSNLQMAEPLRQGRMVALLFDRPHPIHPVSVNLPNGSGYFGGTFLHVARSLECPVFPSPTLRNLDGTYRFEILPPMFIDTKGSREETVNYHMQKITDAFLPYLCQYPESWYQFVPLWEKLSVPPQEPVSGS